MASTLALGACTSSSTGGIVPQPSPSPSAAVSPSPSPSPAVPTPPPGPTPTPRVLFAGNLIGSQVFPNGDTVPPGGSGQTIDGTLACGPVNQTFHIHSHLSLWHNGVQIALPTALGIPGGTSFITTVNGGPYTNNGTCFYNLHTHDSSGIVHIEAPAATSFNLGQVFDIWGQPLTVGNVAGFIGPTLIYVDSTETPAQATLYTGDPRAIVLSNHQQITIEVGGPYVYPLFYTWNY
ncbi:MAG: hypothetical protein M3Z37_09860 [Candidatus Eremiobacteraeota bacterium]|nr:hypothetical protein [Candidatus Eremiobacteraeota bacterium]